MHIHISYFHFLSSPAWQVFLEKKNPEDIVELGSAVQPGPIHLSLKDIHMYPNTDNLYFNI